ncbi:MAG TPA: glycosyltransferase family 2 protein [Gemmatimonadaceae bacterium]
MIAHNQRALVADAIRSVQTQDDPDWELIAVDDGSTDGTLAVLQQFALEDDRIRVIAKDNTRLPSIARNAGLIHARGEIVSFLDGDDQYTPGRLSRVRAAFAACPDANLLFGDYRPYGLPKWDAIGGGLLSHLRMDERYAALGTHVADGVVCIDAEALLPVLVCEFFGAFTLNVAVPRSVIESRAIRFDESRLMAEDYDFVVRVMRGGACIFVRDVLGLWLRQSSTISSSPSAKGYRDSFEVLERHLNLLDAAHVSPESRARVRRKLAQHAFDWGYASARAGDFSSARKAYRASFRYRPAWKTIASYVKAMVGLSRAPSET